MNLTTKESAQPKWKKHEPGNKNIYMTSFSKNRNHKNRNLKKTKASTNPFPKRIKEKNLNLKKPKNNELSIQKRMGEFVRAQLKHFVLSSIAWTLEAFHTMVVIFSDYEPNWHCNIDKSFDDFLSMNRRFESCSSTGSVCSMDVGSMDRATWGPDGGKGVSTVYEWDQK